jgi:hypothetical protein
VPGWESGRRFPGKVARLSHKSVMKMNTLESLEMLRKGQRNLYLTINGKLNLKPEGHLNKF